MRHTQLKRQLPTVVVVDDDEAVCDSLRILLETSGYAVRTFGSATEFQDSMARMSDGDAPRCVILDVHMPDGDGRVLAAALAARVPEVPVILMSARDSAGLTADARTAGAVAFLDKPITHARLFATLERVLAP